MLVVVAAIGDQEDGEGDQDPHERRNTPRVVVGAHRTQYLPAWEPVRGPQAGDEPQKDGQRQTQAPDELPMKVARQVVGFRSGEQGVKPGPGGPHGDPYAFLSERATGEALTERPVTAGAAHGTRAPASSEAP